jgi:long-chain acyl-CoA synthetase
VNRELPETARIRRLALLYKDLDADEEELTRTGKVRREVVAQNYSEIIEGLYLGVASMPVDVSIALQDGKSARIKTTVHFRDL